MSNPIFTDALRKLVASHPNDPLGVSRAVRKTAELALADEWPLNLGGGFGSPRDLAEVVVDVDFYRTWRNLLATAVALPLWRPPMSLVAPLWAGEPIPAGTSAHAAWLAALHALHSAFLACWHSPDAPLVAIADASTRIRYLRACLSLTPAGIARN